MIAVERRDACVVLRLQRPDVGNAFNDQLIAQLLDVLDDLRTDARLRAVVLTGTGKIFSAGADLNWMKRMQQASRAENLRDAERTALLFARLYDFPRPVIAAVNGPARGGGVGLVAASDFALASHQANFAFSEVRLGIIPALISPFVLKKMGESRARRLFLTGQTFTAEQAMQWGLVDRVVAPDQLDEAVEEKLKALRDSGPAAIAAIKRLLHEVSDAKADDVAGMTARMIAELRTSDEGQEGMAAFLEKRPPKWADD